jgi:transposase-like protein
MAKPVTPDKRKKIAQDISAGKGRNQIARDHGIGAGTVSRIAQEFGLTLDRSITKEATAAAVIDHAARRAALAEAQLALAEQATQQAALMVQSATAREASLIAAISIDKYAKLDRYDTDTQNLSAFDRFISSIIGTEIDGAA